MGPNSFRNLTYAAVMAVVGILGYLIFQSGQRQKAKRAAELAQAAELTSGLGGLSDTLGNLTTSPSAALASGAAGTGAAASNAVGSALISPAAAGATSTGSDVKSVMVEDVGGEASSVPNSSSKSKASSSKKTASPATKKAVVKFDAGTGGEFMAMAGAFASKDNADALVAKLKKIGFTKAEVVKLENSANVNVVAGYYSFKGGADAAVRTLKANKVEGFIRKKSGEIFKASTPTAPTKPAVKAVTKPS